MNLGKFTMVALACAVAMAVEATAGGILSDRDGLAAKCSPIFVVAKIPLGNRIGLDIFEMNDVAKSYFQAARLYDKSSSLHLIVETHVLNDAYAVTLKLRRVVDFGGGKYGFAIAWENETFGFHGGTPRTIMDSLSRHYDNFINAYLDVNDTACASRQNALN